VEKTGWPCCCHSGISSYARTLVDLVMHNEYEHMYDEIDERSGTC